MSRSSRVRSIFVLTAALTVSSLTACGGTPAALPSVDAALSVDLPVTSDVPASDVPVASDRGSVDRGVALDGGTADLAPPPDDVVIAPVGDDLLLDAAAPDFLAPDVPPGCFPQAQPTTEGGGRCADLKEAWTARGINVGYYPFRVLAPVPQYSGDYSGDPNAVFAPGPTTKGVILQMIPAGAYVGLSSTGPWYNPPGDCLAGNSCGAPDQDACGDSSPPLRPPIGTFFWGYAYQGASHMQGWIPYDPATLELAAFNPAHRCALGPAGADYEVASVCGLPSACTGTNRTCGQANPCSEGGDDCGRTACGATSGGPLTPTAHRSTVTFPSAAVDCTQSMPPYPGVKCLPNGGSIDFFNVYPFGAYLYWAQNSTTKHWLHYGDQVQAYFHTHDAQNVLWSFVEVLSSGAPTLTPASDGTGAGGSCSSTTPASCVPCQNGGTCGWIQDVFLN